MMKLSPLLARFESLRLLLALARWRTGTSTKMDVKSAFLNGVLDEELHGAATWFHHFWCRVKSLPAEEVFIWT